MESSPESTITQAFNPFVPTQAAYGMGATGLIYEPLIQFNMVSPPKNYPWLATSYTWSNGGKTLTFAIRQGVKWSDGQPFTPADVVFTFDMLKKTAAVNLTGVKYDGVSASGNNVVLTFATPQFANLQPDRYRPDEAGQLHAAGLHAGQEHQLLAGLPGAGPEGLLPGVHVQHQRAQRAVLRAHRLDR
jgi:ABC-type transport system substrate-binding protein